MSYRYNVLLAIDRLFNALTGGDPDETVSSRLGKLARAGSLRAKVACWLIGRLLFHDTGHCSEAIEEVTDA